MRSAFPSHEVSSIGPAHPIANHAADVPHAPEGKSPIPCVSTCSGTGTRRKLEYQGGQGELNVE